MDRPEKLEKSIELGTLFAYYGGLLTSRQREALHLYYEEDLSLGEIADQMHGSRQNVFELISRSADKLQHWQTVLGMVENSQSLCGNLREVLTQLEKAPDSEQVCRAKALLQHLIESQEGEEIYHGI